jgi:hypothetical protein
MFDEMGAILKYSHDGMGLGKLRPFNEADHCRRKAYNTERIIFMARDPRDTAVSAYFHTKLRHGPYHGGISEFVRDPLHGIEKIVLYNLTWFERGPRFPFFLPITYEEMSASPFSVMRKGTNFLGIEVQDVELERVIANNTFIKMHEREATGEYFQQYGGTFSPGNEAEIETFKVRRGKIGGYRDYLSAEDVAYCEHVMNRYQYSDRIKSIIPGITKTIDFADV